MGPTLSSWLFKLKKKTHMGVMYGEQNKSKIKKLIGIIKHVSSAVNISRLL
jgi:hypothetical protein